MKNPETFATLEEELAYYKEAGWHLDEAYWPHRNEKPRFHLYSPNGNVFNPQELVDGCLYECDEVTRMSSDILQEEHRIAGRLFILQIAYKRRYGKFFDMVSLPADDYEKWTFM